MAPCLSFCPASRGPNRSRKQNELRLNDGEVGVGETDGRFSFLAYSNPVTLAHTAG